MVFQTHHETIDVNSKARQWVRAEEGGMIAGVAKGLADSFGLEPWLVRTLWVASVLLLGTGLLVYVVLAFTLPRRDRYEEALEKKMVLGVCGRITRRTDVEIGVVRSLAVALAFLSLGATVVGYLVLYFLMPDSQFVPIETKARKAKH